MSVRLQSPDGAVHDVPDELVENAINVHGFKPIGGTDAGASFETTPAAADTVADKAAAGLSAGLSTATFGATDWAEKLLSTEGQHTAIEKAKRDNPGSAMIGTLAGVVADPFGATGAAAKLGKTLARTEEAVGAGSKIARAAIASGVEGGAVGLGTGIGELASDDHPLTAEHVASTLSSNMLLGVGIGGVSGGLFKAGESALDRAATVLEKAGATKSAIAGVPADLAHLDEAGLREAASSAKAEHAADIAAERKSLEGLRVDQRAELANQVRDFHAELAEERPIFKAVAGEDVRGKVPGIGTDVASPLNKSYRALRAAFDNPIAVAENPTSLLKPLQMQQTALENLQARAPELHAFLAGDARAAALDHVDYAIEQNKAFQAKIRSLDKSAPVGGARLTMLEAGPSQRMLAIDAAKEALKAAPEMGLLAKGAKSAAFAGGTALAHMIPGVGIAAPFLGKSASEFVGRAIERLGGNSKIVAQKSAETVRKFLSVTEKAEKFVPMTATKVLSSVRFAKGPDPKSDKLHDLYIARSAELRSQTMYAADGSVQMRPEARMAMAQKLAPIAAVNPLLADKIETVAARKIAFQSSKLPRKPEVGGLQIGPDTWRPSDLQMRSWARTVRACEDPDGVEQRLIHGNMTPEDAEAYRSVYPERFAAMKQSITETAPTLSRTLPMKRKIALSIFFGVPVTPALHPNVLAVLQGNFASEQGTAGGTQAPAAQPNFGALGSLKSVDKPTPAQQREGA